MQADVQAATAGTVDRALAREFARLAEAAELLGVAVLVDLATETADRLQALRLEVAVVGEFKRGKSSLINALVGREVLPGPPHDRDQASQDPMKASNASAAATSLAARGPRWAT
jgi:ribosome biogenesis GTPase A